MSPHSFNVWQFKFTGVQISKTKMFQNVTCGGVEHDNVDIFDSP